MAISSSMGGNSYYIDDIRRSKELAANGIHYVDVGTSGGVKGLERGYCLMIGGEYAVVERLDPIFSSLAPGAGDIGRTPRAGKGRWHCRTRLFALRSKRCGSLCEDGTQRNRVRDH